MRGWWPIILAFSMGVTIIGHIHSNASFEASRRALNAASYMANH